MKKVTKILSLMLVAVLLTGCLAGCGEKKTSKKGGKGTTDVEISVVHSGAGLTWLDNLIAAFKETNPEYNVYYNASSSHATVTASYGYEDIDTVDLYIAGKMYDTKYLEPLNDVLESTVEGESKPIKDKFNATYLRQKELDGNYYQLATSNGGSIVSLVYNKELFKEANITQLPRTTDELILTAGILYDAGITPFCHYKTIGYYYLMDEAWFSQYNGYDYYLDFYHNPSKDKMLTEDGRYEAIKVHEKITTPNYTLAGSNSESHIAMQTKFMEGKCAMMVNGAWLSNEMGGGEKVEKFSMMKTPVVSSITDKLTTVTSESQLRKLITAIDNVTDGVESIDTYKSGDGYLVQGISVSAADWDYVKRARNTVADISSAGGAYIPTYSNAKEGAKEFLKFMYSDEGIKIVQDAYHVPMPFNLDQGQIDISKWNSFEQDAYKLNEKAEYFVCEAFTGKDRIFIDGGASSFVVYDFISDMCNNSEAERVSAKETWDEITKTIKESYDTWAANVKK